eukprot:TRINITY_DN6247_c1_g1_i1.p1 TRINITY_DN6247_c1_g1~~TRINITY_DN6247_c1_g1_i1.p1  ORF type:complete len:173 (-),score=21.77 TRINITY_DN6247_c1_g1_i1:305-823(-)
MATARGDVVVTETIVQTNIRWDPGYIKTMPGALKLGAVILDLVCMICLVASPPYWREHSVGEWYIFVCMTAFWVSTILLIMYLLHFIEKFHVIPWLMLEFGFYVVWAFFYFTAAIAVAVKSKSSGALLAAAMFGFASMVVYGVDAGIKFIGWRAGNLAQGERKKRQEVVEQK